MGSQRRESQTNPNRLTLIDGHICMNSALTGMLISQRVVVIIESRLLTGGVG